MTRRSALPPVAVALLVALGYLLVAPHTSDLAAQTARAELFRRSGFVPYWSGWYAGTSTISYSLLTPPLLGWLGAVGLGAVALVASAGTGVALAAPRRRPGWTATAVVGVTTVNVFSGRTTFAVGFVIALGAVLALQHRRALPAVFLAVVATLTSPVAGVLLVIVAVGLLVAASTAADRQGLVRHALVRHAMVVAGCVVVGCLLAFVVIAVGSRRAGSGYEPFSVSSLLMAAGTVAIIVLVPSGRVPRVVAGVAILAFVASFAVHSAVGANVTRLAIVGVVPVLVTAVADRRVMLPAVVVALLLPLAQLHNDVAATSDHDTSPAFVAGLRAELTSLPARRDHRVELVDTATHWPSTYLLPTVTPARGWERQVDESRNPEFYGGAPLTAATYRGFLDREAVGFVAVARGVPLDYGCVREAALVRTGLPYLRRIWGDAHWTLYAVRRPAPVVTSTSGPTPREVRLDDTGVSFTVPGRTGSARLRLRWSPYLVVNSGSLSQGADGDVLLTGLAAGRHRVHAVWRLP